jgi:hypothetical protein
MKGPFGRTSHCGWIGQNRSDIFPIWSALIAFSPSWFFDK